MEPHIPVSEMQVLDELFTPRNPADPNFGRRHDVFDWRENRLAHELIDQ